MKLEYKPFLGILRKLHQITFTCWYYASYMMHKLTKVCLYSLGLNTELKEKVSEYDPQAVKQTLQTNPTNGHKTIGRKSRQSNQLSLPYQDDCKTRKGTK